MIRYYPAAVTGNILDIKVRKDGVDYNVGPGTCLDADGHNFTLLVTVIYYGDATSGGKVLGYVLPPDYIMRGIMLFAGWNQLIYTGKPGLLVRGVCASVLNYIVQMYYWVPETNDWAPVGLNDLMMPGGFYAINVDRNCTWTCETIPEGKIQYDDDPDRWPYDAPNTEHTYTIDFGPIYIEGEWFAHVLYTRVISGEEKGLAYWHGCIFTAGPAIPPAEVKDLETTDYSRI